MQTPKTIMVDFTDGKILTNDVMEYFTDKYTATGFTKGLNWYQAAGRIERVMADAEPRIEVPSL